MITGGKPFKMHTEIPLRRTKRIVNIGDFPIADYVTKIESAPVFDSHRS